MTEHFKKREKEIIIAIDRQGRPMSIRELARATGFSWASVKSNLEELNKKGIAIEYEVREGSRRSRWGLNYRSINAALGR